MSLNSNQVRSYAKEIKDTDPKLAKMVMQLADIMDEPVCCRRLLRALLQIWPIKYNIVSDMLWPKDDFAVHRCTPQV